LEEIKEGSKKLIQRKSADRRNEGSLVENAINVLKRNQRYTILTAKEDVSENEIYSFALELCITWLNRILFLKLMEGQLIQYHNGDEIYKFLNNERVKDFDELDELFFEVLAVPEEKRSSSVKSKFHHIPYLNSSLFEETELEKKLVYISGLKDRLEMPIFTNTVLKDAHGKRITGTKNTLHYLFEFLSAYDFASDTKAKIQEQNKTIINASVLGLIFEKINGYKDGSFFTPGFITMYMCRETVRRAAVQKFKDSGIVAYKNVETFEELKDKIEYTDKTVRKEANAIINSLHICDPAVGSGHFLVSALNEIIALKHELRILNCRDGSRIKGYTIIIANDELIITDEEADELFSYNLNQRNKSFAEKQQLQEALFHEKETIIENCLFGVDINPKSVLICRLRLWIELLKNAYYITGEDHQLQTLPNIDINIKCGNSLISRFALDADLKQALKSIKFNINDYKKFVYD
jgi:adenine-specific DNA-methyltransferase